jgi:hypothetical protein
MMIPDTTSLEYVVKVGGWAVYRTPNKYEAHRVAAQWLEREPGSESWPIGDVWVEEPQV